MFNFLVLLFLFVCFCLCVQGISRIISQTISSEKYSVDSTSTIFRLIYKLMNMYMLLFRFLNNFVYSILMHTFYEYIFWKALENIYYISMSRILIRVYVYNIISSGIKKVLHLLLLHF